MKGGMIVDIYVSSIANQTHEQTPFHVYQGTSDFATILNDMRKGELPVGTGKPFPVNFQEEDNPVNPMFSRIKQFKDTFSGDPAYPGCVQQLLYIRLHPAELADQTARAVISGILSRGTFW